MKTSNIIFAIALVLTSSLAACGAAPGSSQTASTSSGQTGNSGNEAEAAALERLALAKAVMKEQAAQSAITSARERARIFKPPKG